MVNNKNPANSFDSNIWIYRFMVDPDIDNSEDVRKHNIATELTSLGDIVLSIQVVNEVCAVLLRKANFNESQIRQVIREFYMGCAILDVGRDTLIQASTLRERYKLSYWDSLIIASALDAGVSKLYSEDMQDSLVVADQLEIVNPFKSS